MSDSIYYMLTVKKGAYVAIYSNTRHQTIAGARLERANPTTGRALEGVDVSAYEEKADGTSQWLYNIEDGYPQTLALFASDWDQSPKSIEDNNCELVCVNNKAERDALYDNIDLANNLRYVHLIVEPYKPAPTPLQKAYDNIKHLVEYGDNLRIIGDNESPLTIKDNEGREFRLTLEQETNPPTF